MSETETATGLLKREGDLFVLLDMRGKKWQLKGDWKLSALRGSYVHATGHLNEDGLLEVFHVEEVDNSRERLGDEDR